MFIDSTFAKYFRVAQLVEVDLQLGIALFCISGEDAPEYFDWKNITFKDDIKLKV